MNNNKVVRLALVTGFLVLLSSKAFARCDKPIAVIASTQGSVRIQEHGSRAWRDVRINDSICQGDMIHTERRARTTVVNPSGSGYTLGQNATLTFTRPKGQECADGWYLSLLRGIMYIRGREPDCYDVNTPFVNAVHKGTEFLVEVDDKKTAITVYDGLVVGENAQGKAEAKPGQAVIAEAGGAPHVRPITVRPEDAVQWALYYPPVIDLSQYQAPAQDYSQGQAQAAKQPLTVRPELAPQVLPSVVEGPVEGQNQKPTAADNNLAPAINAYRQGNINNALAELEKIPQGQQTPQYLTLKAALLLTVGRVDEAEPIISQAQQQQPNNPDALSLQAIIAVTKNRQQQALDLASKAVNNNPGSSTALIALSYAQQSLFKLEEAVLSTRKATQLNPDNALAWARLSELELSQGDHEQALKAAKKAQQLNSKLSRTQTVLGFADLAETEISQAKQQFQQALTLDSTDPLARLGLGLAKIRQGDVEDGKNELETAVNLDPNNAIIRSYLGKSYYELRNKDYAATEYDIAKKLDPKDPTPYFYDAILKQTTNRPVEALHDMQKAIELNDNRGVYRSKLLLDKDTAARQVGLGRIFNNLGFDDPANRQAMKSLALDPGNYSAHRLLSDSYAAKPFYELSRSSELLQSQLLQPLNYNPIQPSLAYTDLNIIRGIGPNNTAFNEYNRMFERDGIKFTNTGIFGTHSTLGDETAISGIYDKFSYSLGQLHYDTNGFRPNNDLEHDIYNAFAQYEISPEVNVQAEYRHRETEHGDLELKGDSTVVDPNYRRAIYQDSYRLGTKIAPSINSNILISLNHANRIETNTLSILDGIDNNYLNTNTYDFETQHLFHNNNFNTVTGLGVFRSDNHKEIKTTRPESSCPCMYDYSTTLYFGYLYSYFKIFNNLDITAGLSYDQYRNNSNLVKTSKRGIVSISDQSGAKVNELNPKFGLIWKANDNLTFRGAVFKSVKPAIFDNQILQPSQVAGFNQFFDYLNGTIAWQYGFGIDSHFFNNVYTGIEASKRDLKKPDSSNSYSKAREELYRFYFNWIPRDYLAINTEFRFENYRGFDNSPKFLETAYIPLELRYFDNTGFFAAIKGIYVNQKMDPSSTSAGHFKSDFYIVDASIGYRFPKQYGLISLEVKNLFDTHFNYRDRQFIMNEQRSSDFVPERMLFARFTFNF